MSSLDSKSLSPPTTLWKEPLSIGLSIVKNCCLCQYGNSFGLGHHHQGKDLKPWFRRNRRPFLPESKKDAQGIIKQVLQKIGQPPLELLCQLLDNPKGGAPW